MTVSYVIIYEWVWRPSGSPRERQMSVARASSEAWGDHRRSGVLCTLEGGAGGRYGGPGGVRSLKSVHVWMGQILAGMWKSPDGRIHTCLEQHLAWMVTAPRRDAVAVRDSVAPRVDKTSVDDESVTVIATWVVPTSSVHKGPSMHAASSQPARSSSGRTWVTDKRRSEILSKTGLGVIGGSSCRSWPRSGDILQAISDAQADQRAPLARSQSRSNAPAQSLPTSAPDSASRLVTLVSPRDQLTVHAPKASPGVFGVRSRTVRDETTVPSGLSS
jgi:hypothetical protein